MSRVTRSASSPQKASAPPTKRRRLSPPSQLRDVLILPDDLDPKTLLRLKLPHPKTGTQAVFLSPPDLSCLHELLSWQQPHRSLLLPDALQRDARILFTARIDPLFVILRYIKADASDVYRSLDDLLTVKAYPDVKRLLSAPALSDGIRKVADTKEACDELVVKFSWTKCASWLESKLGKLEEKLKDDIEIGPHIRLDGIVLPATERKRYAFGILCDYVPMEMHSDLRKRFNISEVKEHTENASARKSKKKRIGDAENVPSEDYFREDLAKKIEEKKLTPVQKQLAKASTGTKSLASFFGKPKPKK